MNTNANRTLDESDAHGPAAVTRADTPLPTSQKALVWASASALLLAACGSSSEAGDDATTDTGAEAVESSATTTTEPEAEPIDPSLVGSTGGSSSLFPDSGNGGYEVSLYDWDVEFSDDLTALSAVSTMTATATQDLQRFSLDARGLEVDAVTVDGVPADFEMDDPELIITSAEPLDDGSEFVVEVGYSVEPGPSDPPYFAGEGWDVLPGEKAIGAVLAPGSAAAWAPLDEDADAPRARYIARFDVPDGFTATAVGVPIEDDGSGEIVWDSRIPVSRFAFAVAETDPVLLDWTVPVEVSVKQGADSEVLERRVVESLTFLESLFGPFPFERMGVTALPGSSVVSAFTVSSPMRMITSGSPSELDVIRQLAWQWAGMAVTAADVNEFDWMLDGLAAYVEALWIESLSDDIDADATTRRLASRVPSETEPLDQIDTMDELFNPVTMDRAALVYHALRLEVGDDAFLTTIREFVQRNLHSTVAVDDLQAVAEEISGRDLDQFFTEWVSEAAVPALPVTDQP